MRLFTAIDVPDDALNNVVRANRRAQTKGAHQVEPAFEAAHFEPAHYDEFHSRMTEEWLPEFKAGARKIRSKGCPPVDIGYRFGAQNAFGWKIPASVPLGPCIHGYTKERRNSGCA